MIAYCKEKNNKKNLAVIEQLGKTHRLEARDNSQTTYK